MKALVVGYGSMGRRRIRLLKIINEDVEIAVVDNNPDRLKQAEDANFNTYGNIPEALVSFTPDISFVCTSPGHHADIILQLVENRIHVFTELNLISDKYDEIIKAAQVNDVLVFMSSTLLYNKQIKAIDNEVKHKSCPLTYIYHIGQYLPDWHPWESYKDFFIGQKKTNGIREIYAIQLPWVINTFGKISDIQAISQRCTDLDIDFDDSFITTFKHENGNIGVFVADIVSRKATTSLEVIGPNFHLFWDGHIDGLKVYDFEKKQLISLITYKDVQHVEGYADTIIEDQYTDEIRNFLDSIKNLEVPVYSLEKDKYVLSLIDKIEGIDT